MSAHSRSHRVDLEMDVDYKKACHSLPRAVLDFGHHRRNVHSKQP